ncbi:MAG: cupin domain-containing protein [Sphaerochaetaceae bacterium]
MYFKFDEKNGIRVPSPFNRVMTPIMTRDQTDEHIDFSTHYTEWDAGAEIDEHMHPASTEVMFCVSGHGVASVDGIEYDFVPDSMICALPGHMHQIKNTGTEKLRVFCIFSPAISGNELKERAEKAVEEYWKNH